MKKRFLILTILALLALSGPALAQVSDNYDLSWHVLAPGGSEGMASSNHLVHGTLGQFAIGPATSESTSLGSGYWSGVVGTTGGPVVVVYQLYLPIVNREVF